MKRLLSLILCLLLLAGCGAPPSETAKPTNPTEPTQTTVPTTEPTSEPTVPPPTVSAQVLALRENLPSMDGSTSLIPLEAGIRAAIFDISIEEATKQVAHSSTWASFYNLLDGNAELIFSCPLSQDQRDIAAEQGIALELVPVAMEGFVFVVNASNPVDSLTQQQLRDIYSGKITNWAQVGGRDEAIIPYQRNTESGSQNYMIDFMGDTPLMDAPVEMRPATMEGLMDVVAINDNASGAIGYSVYAYAADMYGNGNEIKFIRVDGVAPDKQSMASGEYPLLGKNYAIYRADTPADSPVRSLVDWITSYDGQTALARAGYVTLTDIGFDYQEQQLSLWQGSGSGPADVAPGQYEWVLTQVLPTEWGNEYSRYLPVEAVDGVCRITGLADKALEEEINAFIAEQMEWVDEARAEMVHWMELQNRGLEYGSYTTDLPWELYSILPADLPYACLVTAKNGYLSVAVSVCGAHYRMGNEFLPYRTETATWDLLRCERVQPEDLFRQGADVDALLNDLVRSYSMSPLDSWNMYPEMKQDFAGLPMTGWHITHDAIYIDHDNPYFASGERIPLTGLPEGILACEESRNFGDVLVHDQILRHRTWRFIERDTRYAYNSDGLVSCGFLKEEVHPNAAKINAEVMEHLNTYFTREAIVSYYESKGVDPSQVEIWMLDWTMQNLGGRYLLFHGSSPYHMTDRFEDYVRYPAETLLLYDLQSGERISWEELLLEGWRENARDVRSQPNWDPAQMPQGQLKAIYMHTYQDGTLYFAFLHEGLEYNAEIPYDYVNYG